MDRQKLIEAFNEWMRRYTDDPAAFEAEFQTVGLFVAERAMGREPSYGETCVAYIESLIVAEIESLIVAENA